MKKIGTERVSVPALALFESGALLGLNAGKLVVEAGIGLGAEDGGGALTAASLFPGRSITFRASATPSVPQGDIPKSPCAIDGARVESADKRKFAADEVDPASQVVSVRTVSLLPSAYSINRAAMKPALEPVDPVCAWKFVAKTVKMLDDAVRLTVKRWAYSQLDVEPTALLSNGGAPMYS